MKKLSTKLLAVGNLMCPFCTIGRKFPESFIGKKVRAHWEKGCPSNKAYREVFGKAK